MSHQILLFSRMGSLIQASFHCLKPHYARSYLFPIWQQLISGFLILGSYKGQVQFVFILITSLRSKFQPQLSLTTNYIINTVTRYFQKCSWKIGAGTGCEASFLPVNMNQFVAFHLQQYIHLPIVELHIITSLQNPIIVGTSLYPVTCCCLEPSG